MRSAVPSPLAVCALWESLSDFQLCEGLNRPSVPTVLSGIVAPRVFFPSNSHQYFACALTYCSLSPCLDSFIWSPERRGKPTNYFIRGCSSPCLPPLQQSPVLGNCYLSPYLDRFVQSPERRGKPTKNLVRCCSSSCAPPPPPLQQPQYFASALTYRSPSPCLDRLISGPFFFVLTVEKTPAVPCITGWRLRRWFRWFRPGRRCKSSPLNSTFNDNVAFAKQTAGVGLAIRRSRVRVPLLALAGFVLGRP